MRLKSKRIALVALAQLSIVSAACNGELMFVPIPDHSKLLTELRGEHLIMAYQGTDGATVSVFAMDGQLEWREHFRGKRLNWIDVDRDGITVVVQLIEDPELFKNVVFRQGRQVFVFEVIHQGALHVSPDGRFFFPLGIEGGGTMFRSLINERGEPLELPAQLRSRGGNLNFAGNERLLFRMGDPPNGERGTLGLLRLPSDLLWSVPIEPGEFHVSAGQEEAICFTNELLFVGERGGANRDPKLYCLDSTGRIQWEESAWINGIGVLKGSVVTLEKPGVVARDRLSGKTQAQTEMHVDAIQSRQVIEYRDELVFLATVAESGIPPYRVPIRVRFEPDGELTASVMEGFSGVAAVGPNLVGLRHDAVQQRLIVEVIE